LGKLLVLEHVFEYNRGMQLGDPTATTRDQRSRLDEALDHLDTALTDLIDTLDTGGLDHLSTDEKVTVWQRFETLRNRQPLIDHQFIADAEASDLPREYCSSTMTQFLIRVLQLSPGDAAARIRAAAAVGTRTSMLGLRLNPVLPRLAGLQRDGVVSAEKVAIVERAMHKLTKPHLDPHAVETAEQLLTDQAPILGPSDLRRFANAVINAQNGRCMVDRGRTIATASIRTLAALAACRNSLGSGSGAGASRRLGWQRSLFCYWPFLCPDGSDPQSSTPGASPAAPGAYRPSTRREGVRVKGSGISVDLLILITH